MFHPRKKRRTERSDGVVASSKAKDVPANSIDDSEDLNTNPHQAPQSSNSLYIQGLPANTTSEELETHFSQSFPLKHATAILDPKTGKCRGFGFVSFVDTEDAKSVKDELNGSYFLSSKIKIRFAKVRQRGENDENSTKSRTSTSRIDGQATKNNSATPIQPSRLIVRNLPWNVRQGEDLAVLFRSYGKIKGITIPNKKGGLMSGFAFITMRGRRNAAKAMEGVNGKNLHGRTLAVDWAIDRDQWLELNEANEEQNETLPVPSDGIEDSSHIREISDESALAELEPSQLGTELNENSTSEADVECNDALEITNPNERKLIANDQNNDLTIFIRNLPFGCMDDDLFEHFENFGRVRYARVVIDPTTGQSRGTGFVCFRNISDAKSCLLAAPRIKREDKGKDNKFSKGMSLTSIIQDDSVDADGRFTMAGRVLQVSQAVGKAEAIQLKEKGAELRRYRERDKRHLYLLSEGTITSSSSLYPKLSSSEIAMRESSAKQRKTLVDRNPSLHLSFVRLSVRNIPRHVTSKDLKTLARDAIVGFATEVKQGARQPLSREEIGRAAEEMRQNEKERKSKGKGLVKQAKIVYEGREGGKVREDTGGGRSRGYGFIEYYTHRNALMGLRWLNGHAISTPTSRQDTQRQDQERTRRLIVEFAIENAQVVRNRNVRETKSGTQSDGTGAKSKPHKVDQGDTNGSTNKKNNATNISQSQSGTNSSKKREIEDDAGEGVVKRQKIIARKRMARRMKKRANFS